MQSQSKECKGARSLFMQFISYNYSDDYYVPTMRFSSIIYSSITTRICLSSNLSTLNLYALSDCYFASMCRYKTQFRVLHGLRSLIWGSPSFTVFVPLAIAMIQSRHRSWLPQSLHHKPWKIPVKYSKTRKSEPKRERRLKDLTLCTVIAGSKIVICHIRALYCREFIHSMPMLDPAFLSTRRTEEICTASG